MASQYRAGIAARKPAKFLKREIAVDFDAITKALFGGTVYALKGDWYESVKELGSGFIDGLGLRDQTAEELGWRLVFTALLQTFKG